MATPVVQLKIGFKNRFFDPSIFFKIPDFQLKLQRGIPDLVYPSLRIFDFINFRNSLRIFPRPLLPTIRPQILRRIHLRHSQVPQKSPPRPYNVCLNPRHYPKSPRESFRKGGLGSEWGLHSAANPDGVACAAQTPLRPQTTLSEALSGGFGVVQGIQKNVIAARGRFLGDLGVS